MKFRELGLCISLPDHQQVHLLRGRAILEHGPHFARRLAIDRVHESGIGIDHRGPDLVKTVFRVAHLQHHLHRAVRPRKAQRLVETPIDIARLGRGFPLTIDRRKSAGVQHTIRTAIEHFETIFTQIQVVYEPRPTATPGPIGHDLIEGDDLLAEPTRVDVIHAHGLVPKHRVEPHRRLSGGDRVES